MGFVPRSVAPSWTLLQGRFLEKPVYFHKGAPIRCFAADDGLRCGHILGAHHTQHKLACKLFEGGDVRRRGHMPGVFFVLRSLIGE